jgi:chaperonin cofactor prefoldin
MLEEQARVLEREMEDIRKRLEELKKQEVKNA